jgi:hypothetical protein
MSQDLESRLRAALRPVAPGDDFAHKLMARVTAPAPVQPRRFRTWGGIKPNAWWISAGLAASLLLAVGVQRYAQESRERENGLEARREVVEALRVTSQKLNLAYEAVKSQSSSLGGEKSGV